MNIGKFILQINPIARRTRHNLEPRNKNKIRITALGIHQVLAALQDSIQHTQNTANLIDVPVNSRLQLFSMMDLEPHSLTETRALSRCLEMEPLLGMVGLRDVGLEADHPVLVVFLDQVFDDCSRLPQSDSGLALVVGL